MIRQTATKQPTKTTAAGRRDFTADKSTTVTSPGQNLPAPLLVLVGLLFVGVAVFVIGSLSFFVSECCQPIEGVLR